MNAPPNDPADLISAHLDGVLDEAGSARLDAWLQADREHQKRFLRMVMDHRALAQHHAADRHRQPGNRRLRLRRRTPGMMTLAASLAACLAVAGLWWTSTHRDPPAYGPTVTMATLTTLVRADRSQVLDAGITLVPGDRLSVAAGGQARLTYADGTVLSLAENGEAALADSAAGKRLRLIRGMVDAAFASQPAGHPAVIATPESEVTVIGTALTVTSRDGESRTEVSHGRVSLTRLADQATIPVSAGEFAIAAPATTLAVKPIGAPVGTIHAVGNGQTYATLNALPALKPGDVVELHPGVHGGAWRWTAHGTALRPITFRGVGAAPAIVDGTGFTLGTGNIPHALFQIAGAHYIIERITFTNARNGGTATGISCTDRAYHTRIRDCHVTRCDKGIDSDDNDLRLDDSEVGWCGTPENEGFSHALVLRGSHVVLNRCDIHDALHGQAIKCRSRYLEIRSCRITDAEDGEIGLIDGPGTDAADANVVLIGNLVASKSGRKGNQQRFIEVGNDTGGTRRGTLYLINNTFVAADPRIIFVATAMGAMRTIADNNIFIGSDRIVALGNNPISGQRNWMPTTAMVPTGLTERIPATTAGPGFVAPAARDFRLRADSPCAGQGMADGRYRDDAGRDQAAGTVSAPGLPSPTGTTPTDGRPSIGAYAVEH